MIPILFDSDEEEFATNGIGRLADIKSGTVKEQLNGLFEMEMTYPINGIHFDDIQFGRYIFCSVGKNKKQPFEIYEISKPLNGLVTIYARHISYRANLIPIRPFTATGLSNTLAAITSNAMTSNPFTLWTDKTSQAVCTQTAPLSLRSCLGGVEGSVLDVFGGEYEWDMWTIKLLDRRGADNGVQFRYGKNITQLEQSESIDSTITGIVPYWANQDNVVCGDVLTSGTESNYAYPRIKVVDVSDKFEGDDVPTKAQVNAAGRTYMNSNGVGIPEIGLNISFINLRDTREYKDIAVLEDVEMGDTVYVYVSKLGVNASSRVTKTEWDIVQNRYKSISIGSTRATLSTSVANQSAKSAMYVTSVEAAKIAKTYVDASQGTKGGYVAFEDTNSDGYPDELLVMDSPYKNSAKNVWRFNREGWSYSQDGYKGNYLPAADIKGGFNADYIKLGTIKGIRLENGSLAISSDGAIAITKNTGSSTISYKINDEGLNIIYSDDTSQAGANITVSQGKPVIDGFTLKNCTSENGTSI